MTVSATSLLVHEEALRNHQMKLILRARHCDIQQPALLFDLLRGADSEIDWNAAIDRVEHK
jgi:hypothetical protein